MWLKLFLRDLVLLHEKRSEFKNNDKKCFLKKEKRKYV